MAVTDLLLTIKTIWLAQLTLVMTKAVVMRDDLQTELDRFFTAMIQSIESGDPGWLDPLLSDWALSLTMTDLQGTRSNLVWFITVIMEKTFQVCRETLDDAQSLDAIITLLPAFTYSLEFAARQETEAKIAFISTQLTQTRDNLEKLDKSKSDFIAVAAHELKTPLTLVEGYTAMLAELIEKQESLSSVPEMIAGINTGASRLRSIIDNMIDVTLIDNRLLALNQQPVWINRLFSVLADELKSALIDRQLSLTINPFPGSAEMTFADPDRLLQVFRNLLVNAIKFTPDQGHIWVDGRKLPGFIEITISDDGIGIDTDDQAVIFEKFALTGNVSLHSSGKTKFKGGGPGLGLHIAKGIIEAHGGAIWVESDGRDEIHRPGPFFTSYYPLSPNQPTKRPPDYSRA